MRSTRRAATFGATVAATSWLLANPAFANDVTVYVPAGETVNWAGKGTWDDSHDNLCVTQGSNSVHYKAVARISPSDGVGPVFTVTDDTRGDGGVCTGNLSIPEDELYVLRVTVYYSGGTTKSNSKTFYT